MNQKARILIIEDEQAILQGLIDVFVFHGYEVDSASDGLQGLEKAKAGGYDIVLLDVMLPSLDGFSVCNALRQHDRAQAIIMLTAKTSDEDIINGLTFGADDYVAKPFSVRQLVLRVEAVLRRSQKLAKREREIYLGTIWRIDAGTLEGFKENDKNSEPVMFTRREIEILQYLKAHSDRPVPREELLEEVWDYRDASFVETRTVDIHIAKLRKKIERDPKNPLLLVTLRGEGYRLMEG